MKEGRTITIKSPQNNQKADHKNNDVPPAFALVKKILQLFQHLSPEYVMRVVWYFFTKPRRRRFSPAQTDLMKRAHVMESNYRGHRISAYRWGQGERKVLVCHGWHSRTADFRRMIEAFENEGYVVEGVDMRAHGRSEGSRTALPEFCDLIEDHVTRYGPYEIIVGYSLGALASGVVMGSVPSSFQPKQFFCIAGPPYARYFFESMMEELGLKDEVYRKMCDRVERIYSKPVDHFDLRKHLENLYTIDTHLIYSEDDEVVPFEKGLELLEEWQDSTFVRVRGANHYKIVSDREIIDYVMGMVKKNMILVNS